MKLQQSEAIKAVEERISKILTDRSRPPRKQRHYGSGPAPAPPPKKPKTIGDRGATLRAKVRKAIKETADATQSFTSASSGDETYDCFKQGFAFVQKIPAGVDVVHEYRFEKAGSGAYFWYTASGLQKLADTIASFEEAIRELEDLREVQDIMVR